MIARFFKSLFLSLLIALSMFLVFSVLSSYAGFASGFILSLGLIISTITFTVSFISFYLLGSEKGMINKLLLVFILIILMEVGFMLLNGRYQIINYLLPLKYSSFIN